MLTPELIDALLAPISEASPCGEDLEYDAAFMAAEAAAQGRPEQQFGDTVIPAVEPEWPQVADQTQALLRQTKDLRPAVNLLRASTRMQGLAGFHLGMQLLIGLLERYWGQVHPLLDVDDDHDPTMRLNAMAPLADETLLIRDVLDAPIGVAAGVGTIRVRDVAIARNLLAPLADAGYTQAQVQGALEDILSQNPKAGEWLSEVAPIVTRLQTLLAERSGRPAAVDFSRLHAIGQALQQSAKAVLGSAGVDTATAADIDAPGVAAAPSSATARGDLTSRQDALLMLDRVIRYLEETEPGNPAPLLIERAKKLIGVSFLDIIANLAPDAMNAIENVTGPRVSE